ncbi:MAG: HAD family hydrolase [Candidatus Levybacteria bacterium]|nr:HAD family hydrolase [Candidatus Levybacteria bacterium]
MIKAVLFDFDGVIIDSEKSTIEFFQETFRHFNLPIPQKKDFEPLAGLKTIDMVRRLLPHLPEEKITPIFEDSLIMSVKYVSRIELFPKARETLEILKKNYKLGVITNRSKLTIEALFELHKLREYFQITLTRDDITKHKPHPQGLKTAMKKLGVLANEAIYVGDTKIDVDAAHNAKIPCVLISPAKNDFGADYQMQKIEELPKLIAHI